MRRDRLTQESLLVRQRQERMEMQLRHAKERELFGMRPRHDERRGDWPLFISLFCIVLGVLFGLAQILFGCAPAHPARPEPGIKADSLEEIPPTVWSIVESRCAWCHTPPSTPAGIDFSTPSTLRDDQVQLFADGLRLGLAPFIEGLPWDERIALLTWASAKGADVLMPAVPGEVRWVSDTDLVIASGTAAFPAHAFGFVLEDGHIESSASSAWTVGIAPDGGPSVVVRQSHRPGGTGNPSSYLAFAVPWHERVGDQEIRFRMRPGRWSGAALRVRSLHAGDRGERLYVRGSVDRDAIALVSTPTALETRPPDVADCCLAGNIYAAGFYLTGSQTIRVEMSVVDLAGGAHYRLRALRETDGLLLADLAAISERDLNTTGGFSLWCYGVDATSIFWDVEWTGWIRQPTDVGGFQ